MNIATTIKKLVKDNDKSLEEVLDGVKAIAGEDTWADDICKSVVEFAVNGFSFSGRSEAEILSDFPDEFEQEYISYEYDDLFRWVASCEERIDTFRDYLLDVEGLEHLEGGNGSFVDPTAALRGVQEGKLMEIAQYFIENIIVITKQMSK